MVGQVLGLWSGKKTTHLLAIQSYINNILEDTFELHPPCLDGLSGRAGRRLVVMEGGVEAHPALLRGVGVPLLEEQALVLLHAAVVVPPKDN